MKFTDHTIDERKSIIKEFNTPDPIHDLIGKHLGISAEESRSLYRLKYEEPRNLLTIEGDLEPMANLFMHLQRFLTPINSKEKEREFDLINPGMLRFDLDKFLDKVM